MALMLGKLNDALLAAGASQNQAREAAEEVAGYEAKINGFERRLDQFEARVETRFTVLYWMVGFNLALTAAILGKLLTLH